MTGTAQKPTVPARKAYVKPELKTFGPLHKLTQGSTGSLGDGGSSKRSK